MKIFLYVVQVVLILCAVLWLRGFGRGYRRLMSLYLSVCFAGGAFASFHYSSWLPIAIALGAVVIGGTVIEVIGSLRNSL
jgi:hypothetical protein